MIIDYEDDVRNGEPEIDLSEEIRVELRRFFNANIGKKPTVVPVILEL
jgi:mRNA degradation ribonuclease J1/J2